MSRRYIASMKSWFSPLKGYFSSQPTSSSGANQTQNDSCQSNASGTTQFDFQPQTSASRRGQKNFEVFTDSQMNASGWSKEMRDNEMTCNQNLRTTFEIL